MTRSWWWLIIDVLAVARLTRLVTLDTISDPPREWLQRRYRGRLIELITCPWCFSVWVAGGVTAATLLVPSLWQYLAFVLAISYAAAWLMNRE